MLLLWIISGEADSKVDDCRIILVLADSHRGWVRYTIALVDGGIRLLKLKKEPLRRVLRNIKNISLLPVMKPSSGQLEVNFLKSCFEHSQSCFHYLVFSNFYLSLRWALHTWCRPCVSGRVHETWDRTQTVLTSYDAQRAHKKSSSRRQWTGGWRRRGRNHRICVNI